MDCRRSDFTGLGPCTAVPEDVDVELTSRQVMNDGFARPVAAHAPNPTKPQRELNAHAPHAAPSPPSAAWSHRWRKKARTQPMS